MTDTNEPTSTPDEEEVVFHTDPVINLGLRNLEAKLAFYALAHGVITGKFDENYSDWLKRQKITEDIGDLKLPDVMPIIEWAHIDASLSELLAFKIVVDKVMTEVNLAIFGKYAQKNVRGTVPADTDLTALRKEVVKLLDGTMTMIDGGIIENPMTGVKMTVADVLKLPTLVKWAKNAQASSPRRADGTWIIPNAPSQEKNGDAPSAPTGNLRSHNSQVKFVVNGALFECATLGEACAKLFGAKKPAEVAGRFEDWNSDYFAVGDEKPKKMVRDGDRDIWLTKVG